MTENTKTIAIVGLGITGWACVEYFSTRAMRVLAMDERSNIIVPENLTDTVEVGLGAINQNWLSQADEIIVSPGVDPKQPCFEIARKKNIPIIGDVEVFLREINAPVVAVTGSNGKSTIVSLLHAMAIHAKRDVALGGNIGYPVLFFCRENVHDLYILELSSFQLDTTYSLAAEVACISNISPDHLDRYGNMENYIASKQRIYENAKIALYNRDDEHTKAKAHKDAISFGYDAPVGDRDWGVQTIDGKQYLMQGKEQFCDTESLKLKGKHAVLNALCAAALADEVEIPKESILAALYTFTGLAHRYELVGSNEEKLTWVNDSKATNLGAAIAAIEGTTVSNEQKIVLIAGGDNKHIDLSPLDKAVATHCRCVIVIGLAKEHLSEVIKTVPVISEDSMADAVNRAKQEAQSGDIVLLAPACASTDMFRNYEERGDAFKQAVMNL